LWAQRSSATAPEKNVIFLTISVPDVPASSCKIDLKPTSLTFSGHSDTKNINYHVELNFYGEVDVENSKTNHTARDIEFVLRKKETKEEYWPRLLKDAKKAHYLKTDFDKVRETLLTANFVLLEAKLINCSGLTRMSKKRRPTKILEGWVIWAAWAEWVEWAAWVEWVVWVVWAVWEVWEEWVVMVASAALVSHEQLLTVISAPGQALTRA